MSPHVSCALVILVVAPSAALRMPSSGLPRIVATPSVVHPHRTAPTLVPHLKTRPAAASRISLCDAECSLESTTIALVKMRSRLWGVGWLAWWSQVILSSVSGVLLLFANSVSHTGNAATLAGRLLALAGLAAAFVSTFWSWGYTRLSLRLERRSTPAADAAAKALRALRIGRAINLLGMGLSILGAEAIVVRACTPPIPSTPRPHTHGTTHTRTHTHTHAHTHTHTHTRARAKLTQST